VSEALLFFASAGAVMPAMTDRAIMPATVILMELSLGVARLHVMQD
jgi:hypothetical protein